MMLGEESWSPGPVFTTSVLPRHSTAGHGKQTSWKDVAPTGVPRDHRALPMHFFKP